MKQRTTTPGLVLTIAAVFLGGAGVVVLISGFGGTETVFVVAGIVLLVLAGASGVGAATR